MKTENENILKCRSRSESVVPIPGAKHSRLVYSLSEYTSRSAKMSSNISSYVCDGNGPDSICATLMHPSKSAENLLSEDTFRGIGGTTGMKLGTSPCSYQADSYVTCIGPKAFQVGEAYSDFI